MVTPMPPMGADASRRALLQRLVSWLFVLGVFLLAVSAVASNVGSMKTVNPTPEQDAANLNWKNVYSPMIWNFGMFFVLTAVFGTAAMSEQWDPLARILVIVVALVAALLVLSGGVTLFK